MAASAATRFVLLPDFFAAARSGRFVASELILSLIRTAEEGPDSGVGLGESSSTSISISSEAITEDTNPHLNQAARVV